MCFSAEASFAASGVLAASSVAIWQIPKEKRGIPLAVFPAIFATHQFIEGILWLNHDGILPDTYQPVAVHAYALIAFVLWPIFVPFAAYMMEAERRRRIIILICQALGLWVGLTLLLGFLRAPVQVSADCCSLSYQVDAPDLLIAPYLAAVSLPFLASSRRSLVLFGVGITVSCAAAALSTSAETFPSVWCFFAAILSAGLLCALELPLAPLPISSATACPPERSPAGGSQASSENLRAAPSASPLLCCNQTSSSREI